MVATAVYGVLTVCAVALVAVAGLEAVQRGDVSEELAEMDAEYRDAKAKIRADPALTYEARERKVRALGLEHTERRRTAEGAIADRCLSTPGGGGRRS